jgi:hypothetical protein
MHETLGPIGFTKVKHEAERFFPVVTIPIAFFRVINKNICYPLDNGRILASLSGPLSGPLAYAYSD